MNDVVAVNLPQGLRYAYRVFEELPHARPVLCEKAFQRHPPEILQNERESVVEPLKSDALHHALQVQKPGDLVLVLKLYKIARFGVFGARNFHNDREAVRPTKRPVHNGVLRLSDSCHLIGISGNTFQIPASVEIYLIFIK